MAAKAKKSASAPRTPVRRTSSKTTSGPVVVASAGVPEPEPAGARALVKAGLKALGEVRGDMLARQARIFELLLGIGQAPGWRDASAKQAADPFGKFEDVFDQRVARALVRLGMPSPQALQALAEQVNQLTELLAKAPGSPRKEPRRRRP